MLSAIAESLMRIESLNIECGWPKVSMSNTSFLSWVLIPPALDFHSGLLPLGARWFNYVPNTESLLQGDFHDGRKGLRCDLLAETARDEMLVRHMSCQSMAHLCFTCKTWTYKFQGQSNDLALILSRSCAQWWNITLRAETFDWRSHHLDYIFPKRTVSQTSAIHQKCEQTQFSIPFSSCLPFTRQKGGALLWDKHKKT